MKTPILSTFCAEMFCQQRHIVFCVKACLASNVIMLAKCVFKHFNPIYSIHQLSVCLKITAFNEYLLNKYGVMYVWS